MKKIVNFRPALYLAIGMALSIASAYYLFFKNLIVGLILLGVLLLAIILFICFGGANRKRNAIFSLLFAFFFIISGSNFYFQVDKFNNSTLENKTLTVVGRVCEISKLEGYSALILKDVSVSGGINRDLNHKIALNLLGENDVDLGSVIRFTSKVSDRGMEYEGIFRASDISSNVKYSVTANSKDIEILSSSPNLFEKVHIFIRDTLEKGLSDISFPVAYAFTLGNSDYMDDNTLTSFRQAGVAHIFAVSGLHIGFFATVLNFILDKLKCNRKVKILIILPVLFFYSGVCGFTASSIRASIMCSVLTIASAFGKRYDGLSSLGLAGIIILLFNPVQFFCIGFQLSFATVLGINLLSTKISNLFKFTGKKLSSAIGVSASATIFSFPLCIFAFSETSIISILVNLLLLPLVSFLYILTFATTILGGILTIPNITLFISDWVIKGIVWVMQVVDFKMFLVGFLITTGAILTYFAGLIVASGLINFKRVTRVIVSLVLMVSSIAGTIGYNLFEKTSEKVVISGRNDICATALITEKETLLFVSAVDGSFSVSGIKRILDKNRRDKIDRLIIANGENPIDEQNVLTRLNYYFDLDKIYYFGDDKTPLFKIVMESSFPKFTIKALSNLEEVIGEAYAFNFSQDGYCVDLTTRAGDIKIFSRFGEDFVNVGEGYGNNLLIVAYDYIQFISGRYKSNRIISYLPYSIYENALTKGNVTVKLD